VALDIADAMGQVSILQELGISNFLPNQPTPFNVLGGNAFIQPLTKNNYNKGAS
jgi:hypothetical protein